MFQSESKITKKRRNAIDSLLTEKESDDDQNEKFYDSQSHLNLNATEVKQEPVDDNNKNSSKRPKEPPTNILPNIIQSHSIILAKCSNGVSVEIEDDNIRIVTSSGEKITIENDSTNVVTRGCTIDFKDGAVRLQSESMDSLFNFS